METFYRWQRRRLGYLMDGDEPATGRWNYDEENRKPLPKGGVEFPDPVVDDLDDVAARLRAVGAEVDESQRTTFPGHVRLHTFDGHGNRVEVLQPL